MENGIKRKLTEAELTAIMDETFGMSIKAFEELSDGWANSAYAITLQDDRAFILKVAPTSDTKLMTYEQNLMTAEVEAMRLVKQQGYIPIPFIYAHDASEKLVNCEYFIMEKLEGDPYNKVKESLTETDCSLIEFELGVYNRKINDICGTHFGYFVQTGEPQNRTWKETFHGMILDVLADGERAGVVLPVPYDTIRLEIKPRLHVLEEVTEPKLVHWDLWDGNVFVKERTITGLIDFERALWGDPLMEVYFGHFNSSQPFLQGYRIGELSAAQRGRRVLYDLYLDLILTIECAYRLYEDEGHINWTRNNMEQGWKRFMNAD